MRYDLYGTTMRYVCSVSALGAPLTQVLGVSFAFGVFKLLMGLD